MLLNLMRRYFKCRIPVITSNSPLDVTLHRLDHRPAVTVHERPSDTDRLAVHPLHEFVWAMFPEPDEQERFACGRGIRIGLQHEERRVRQLEHDTCEVALDTVFKYAGAEPCLARHQDNRQHHDQQ